MSRFCTKSMNVIQPIAFVVLILMASIAQSHIIHKRHDIIEGGASSDNDTVVFPEAPALPEYEIDSDHNAKDVINNEETNNVNGVQESKVSSIIDENNGIEQNFTSHTNQTANNVTLANSQTSFTKDFSQDDSIENRLPSKPSDKSASNTKSPARISTVSLKEATRIDESKEAHATVPITRIPSSEPSEKPKRIDTSFARSTERAVADVEISTIPVSRTTASILSTIALAPKISATETIRARISSIPPEVTERRGSKYLSGRVDSSSPSSAHNPEASWSDLKTVGEVHHNNVTLGKSLAQEDSIKLVNGKLDSEEVAEKASMETSSTEKSADEHETQLQKSNSSRIVDVPDDNSLSSFQSSSNRPTLPTRPVTLSDFVRKVAAKDEDETKEQTEADSSKTELPSRGSSRIKAPNATTENVRSKPNPNSEPNKSNLETPNSANGQMKLSEEMTKSNDEASKTVEVASTTVDLQPTEAIKNEESTEELTEKVTEKDVYTTTEEEEEATTIDDGTTILDEITTLSHIPKVRSTTTKENLVIETTTTAPTTETTDIPTTIYVTTPKEDENKVHHDETTRGVIPKGTSVKTIESTSNTTPVLINQTDMTTQEVTKPLTQPTKAITTKTITTETNQRIILPTNESKPTQSSSSTTQTSAATTQSTPSTTQSIAQTVSSTVLQENVSTEASLPITPQIISFASTTGPTIRKSPDTSSLPEHQTEVAQGEIGEPRDINAMIAIGISVIAVVTLILLVGFLVVMRKRQKQLTYGQRCRPIGLDAYSLDNISVYNSVRRKSAIRTSKRAFGNAGFDDPGLKNNPLNISQLATFSQKRVSINEEFKDIPTVTARIEEVPIGCEDKNRYANVVPLPESRVHLKRQDDDERTEYINANFVKGPKDTTHYYIACQAPLEQTITDFWRMIWENNSRVIIMATDLTENGIEKCAEYLPSSFVIDNHVTFGDYQITLKNREVRDKYAVSTVHLKNAYTKTWREITHFWYQWPENGVPPDEASVIAMLLEARSYLKMITPEQSDENGQAESDLDGKTGNGNLDKTKSLQRVQGPLTVHCSPGTGRTGTIIACDIAIRSLEQPTRNVDIPQIVYFVRRGRASAVQTREQYEFIYKVAHVYATKLTGQASDN